MSIAETVVALIVVCSLAWLCVLATHAHAELVRIRKALENPPETIEEAPESVAARNARLADQAPRNPPPATFGSMSKEERAAIRAERRALREGDA